MPTSFGEKLAATFERHGQLCVGIDPHASLLDDWGLPQSVDGLREFSFRVLDAVQGQVGIVKPQVSFFERFGSAGFAVLEEVAQRAQAANLTVIMDAKRGDIGTTMAAYFEAWLGKSAPFVCDALTVNPFLGLESLSDQMSDALERGKGLIVLVATSNPEGTSIQKSSTRGETISAQLWRKLQTINGVTAAAGARFGSFGAVVGATLDVNAFGLSDLKVGQPLAATPILAPGFGAQGAELFDARRIFGNAADQVIFSVSRSVLSAGNLGLNSAIVSAKLELEKGLAVD